MISPLGAEWADAPVVACWLDGAGVVTQVSAGWAALAGPTPGDLVGRSLSACLRPDSRPGVASWLAAGGGLRELAGARTDGLPWCAEVDVVAVADGGPTVVAGRAVGGPVGWRHQRREADVQRAPGLDAVVSHDLRASLRHARGFAGVALRSVESVVDRPAELDSVPDRLRTVAGAVATADEVAERVVQCLRLGSAPYWMEELDLTAVVGEADDRALARFEAEDAPARSLAVPVPAAVADLPRVIGDRSHLVTAFAELLVNGRRFGADPITVSAGPGEAWVEVTVADGGPGVPGDLAEDAFGPGRMLQGRGEHPGVGMGLAICRTVVRRHAGTVAFAPPGGAGGRVRLVLPGIPVGPNR